MQVIHPSRLLKFALLADAAGSGTLAVLQLSLVDRLSNELALPHALLWESGLFLVAYVALLIGLARSSRVWSALISVVVLGNVGWAVACVGLLFSGLIAPNALGEGYLLFQALAVLGFAGLELKGLMASVPVSKAKVLSAA